jgi:hypothetical protein
MVKPRSKKLAHSIKLKPRKKIEVIEGLERITITIPRTMKYALDELIIDRKRNKKPNRSASAMIRASLKVYLKKYEM